MSDPPLLIANLGAETRSASPASDAATHASARLWRLSFPSGTRILGDAEAVWPDALGPEPESPVFPWLEGSSDLPDSPDHGSVAFAWLVTEAARREAEDRGRTLVGPPPDAVRRVHDKAFALEACRLTGFEPDCLAGALHVLSPEDLADPESGLARIRAGLESWPEWLRESPSATLKPRFGCSGRGRVAFSDPGDPALPGSFARLAEHGGAILEPWLTRCADLSAQLHLGPEGPLLLGTLTQCPTPAGVPRGLRGTLDRRGRVTSGTPWDEPLREAAAAVAVAAGEAGFSGPCGVDAFAFRGPASAEAPVLRPVVELNARFTLGCVAIGLARRALPRARAHFDLDANERLHFHLGLDPGPGLAPGPNAEAQEGVLRLDLGGAPGQPGPSLRLAREPEALDP